MFIKKDGTYLETIKLVAKNLNDAEKTIIIGIFIERLFYRQKRSIQIIRCFKCQRFGHESKNCNSTPRCGHCSGNHNFKSFDEKVKLIVLTSTEIAKLFRLTPPYLKCISDLSSLRGTTLPNHILKLMNRLHIGNDVW